MILALRPEIYSGMVVSGISLLVVFVALVILWLCMELTSKILNLSFKKVKQEEKSPKISDEISGEVMAAISTAVHLYLSDIHDLENPILTIKRSPKSYSPWSSKIYSVLTLNRKFNKAS
jgi:Na+-transporting methylmalonyl-CoA/oxaloacetate decarboxylase gamma subunit